MMHSILNAGTTPTDTKTDGFNARMATRNVEENMKLIELIKERPILYDSSLVGYKVCGFYEYCLNYKPEGASYFWKKKSNERG